MKNEENHTPSEVPQSGTDEKIITAWRTIKANKASNARGIYPEQCALHGEKRNHETGE